MEQTLEEFKAQQTRRLLIDFEEQLRSRAKYADPDETTWQEVRDWYHSIRNEYLVIDLMEEI